MTQRSPLLIAEAVALVLLGVLAIIFPIFSGIAVGILLGWLLVIVGVLGVASAFAGRDHLHVGWSVASGVIGVVAGVLLLLHPLFAAVAITILLAAYLLFDGVTLIGLGLDQRKRGSLSWRWPLGSGVVDVLLGVLLLLLGPGASAALIGFVVGIDLIAAGAGLYVLHRKELAPRIP
jgi:uncharacterized membrane protein HdeD (DUF308 family)